jgi:hypothetical protein
MLPATHLRPHFLDILQNHVAVPIESFDAAEELLVVAAVDEDLSVVLDRLGENAERSGVEFFLLKLLKFFGSEF